MRKSRFGGDPPSIPPAFAVFVSAGRAVKSESGVVQSSLKRRTGLLSAHGVTGFAQISSIYSQNYHPVTDAWESVPIASHLSFCTKGIPCPKLQNPLFQKAKENLLPGEKVPVRADEGWGKVLYPGPHPPPPTVPPLPEGGSYSLDDGFCDSALRLRVE